MFLLRDIRPDDIEPLHRLARLLDTVNLPADRDALAALIARSRRSFAGQHDPPDDGLYIFALVDERSNALLGTSMIVASHGTPEDPHNFFRIDTDERFSPSLKRLFQHETLTFAQSFTPHTELGGLILDPEHRGHPRRLGTALSLVRLFYIALHPERFRDHIQAELLPPFEEDGSSRLWEWLGRRFTGLDYPEADRISRTQRDFIPALFPRVPIYTALLPPDVREVIGAVGPETQGVARMLTALGFAWNRHIDPFDGGPHYEAHRDRIPLLRDVRTCISDGQARAEENPRRCFVRRPSPEGTFEALDVDATLDGDRVRLLPPHGLPSRTTVDVLPLPHRTPRPTAAPPSD